MRLLLVLLPLAAFAWNATDIKTVHVIQSCHLDVGFADTAPNIINRYFDHYFPSIIQIAAQLENDHTTNATLQFMAQSYVVSLYLDCPPNMEIHCPSQANVTLFKQAIQKGWIYYHAFPFNAEIELYANAALISAGVQVTHNLDAQFGFPPKKTLSQRDVPGTTRSLIPILKKLGVDYISVGVNPASYPPAVPSIFLWKDGPSGESMISMWHPGGYGGILVSDAVMVPGLTHALVFDWNGDNQGPYTLDEYKQHFIQIQQEFPNAQVVSSTFDNFTQYLPAFQNVLPVITQEIGDTWIHGAASDPKKVATFRAFNRVWDKFQKSGGNTSDPVYLNASRLAIKNQEHTWGLDVKLNLVDDYSWTNQQFEFAKQEGNVNASQYNWLELSWWRQRWWGIGIPYDTLVAGGHPLVKDIDAEMAQMQVKMPSTAGYTQITGPSQLFKCGAYQIQFDMSSGAIVHLSDGTHVWATPNNTLFSYTYRSYSQAEYQVFIAAYIGMAPPVWAEHDFGKFGDEVSQAITEGSMLRGLYMKREADQTSFLLEIQVGNSSFLYTNYGAPAAIWESIVVPHKAKAPIPVTLSVINKTATRLPESMFVGFNPPTPAAPAKQGNWWVDKLGEWIEWSDVINGGAKHMHGHNSGYRYALPDGGMLRVESVDAGVVVFGQPTAFPTPCNQSPDMSYGASALLWDNVWGTNYVMWYPFKVNYTSIPGDEDMLYRFVLHTS